MNVVFSQKKHLFLAWFALLLTGCATMLTPVVQQQKSANPPALDEWRMQVPVDFFLVNGVNNFPFGMDPKNDNLPNYLGCANYDDFYKKLGSNDKSVSPEIMQAAETAGMKNQFGSFIDLMGEKLGYHDAKLGEKYYTPH